MPTANETIEAVVEHVTYTKGVVGVVICTPEGVPLRDTFQSLDRTYAAQLSELAADIARQAALLFDVAAIDAAVAAAAASPTDARAGSASPTAATRRKSKSAAPRVVEESTLELLRVRTLMNEIIVQCCEDFLLVVVQEPTD